ncbi:TPA: hypothetical protein HIE87_004861 [Escherichia coli]|nr:hypothetical protein [Escherichia coli]EFB3628484.1 hypothetical protein [Escherichia coli]EFH6709359.1 hypothetical protein [Escherichia coli]EFJ9382624.1 hypothetical protein [Escherichia coli]HAH3100815.1 hypothetical protein [Escherichia coli]
MHELEVLLSRLKMEHLSYHVESLLEQAAKKELNYREFLCIALQQEWNDRQQRSWTGCYTTSLNHAEYQRRELPVQYSRQTRGSFEPPCSP